MKLKVPLLQSRLLAGIPGIVHGFTTREVLSETDRVCTNFDLSLINPTTTDQVRRNRKLLLESLGVADARWMSIKQVHGNEVVQLCQNTNTEIEADAIWTLDLHLLLAVLVADCVPILIAEESGESVAAIHAGWRGTQLRIGNVLLKKLQAQGFQIERLYAAIGPAIGPCCFKIKREVADALINNIPTGMTWISKDNSQTYRADLWELNKHLLEQQGVPAENIDVIQICTKCSSQFFSFRREGKTTGRQAGVIGRA